MFDLVKPLFSEIFSLIMPPHEILLKGLWGGVIIAGLYIIVCHWRDGRKFGHALDKLLSNLSGIPKEEVPTKFNMLKRLFEEDKRFQSHWQEFQSTLVIRDDSVLTTTDASYFFNEYTLVDGPMGMEIKRHVPAILTSFGIIGTFAGLLIGLNDFSDTNLQQSITNLLSGVKNAFACSFMAILMAVFVTISERLVISSLYGKVHRLQENLNRLFNKSVTESYLHDMLGQMDQQTQSLKSFNQDLSQSIQSAMQDMVKQQTTAMQEANAEVARRITDSMSSILAPAVNRMTDSVEEMQRKQSESSEEALRGLVSQFGESMQQAGGRQMDAAVSALAGTADTMVELRGELGGFMGAMREQMTTQQAQMQAHIEAMTSQQGAQQEKLQGDLQEFVTRTATMMTELQHQMASSSSVHAGQISEAVEGLLKQSRLTSGEMAAQQERYAQRLTELMTALEGLMSDFDSRIDQHEGLVAAMAAGLQQAGQAAKQMALSAETYARIQEQVQRLLQQGDAQAASVEQRLALFDRSVAQMKDTVDHHGRMLAEVETKTEDFFGAVEQGVGKYQAAVQDGMEKYHGVASASLNDFLSKVDNEMSKAVGSLGTSVSELDEALDGLSALVSKAAQR